MINLKSITKVQTKNVSLRLPEQTNDIADCLCEKINEIAAKNYSDTTITKPVLLRELIDYCIYSNAPILEIYDKKYTIQDILTYNDSDKVITEFNDREVESIVDLFSKELLKEFLIETTLYVCIETMKNIRKIDIKKAIDEEVIENYENALECISIYYNDISKNKSKLRNNNNVVILFRDIYELVDNYCLNVEDMEELFIQNFKDNYYQYEKLLLLYYYKPSTYNICINQFDIIIENWLRFCEFYELKNTKGELIEVETFEEFLKKVEEKIGESFEK
ncbi:hypothetical protein [Clostridium sardiniense]|uniref:hypothetical protein n=1 Tax=Clostridium sardiniense TaxID=29369 RepID=UPI0019560C61|nr:hypothetical protein [Clostridium sardiniense]MBM7836331.1 hypothetical protein [Clostridium sardiniense]